jgi:hypothetical protein
MLGLFDPPKGIPCRDGYHVDAMREGASWRGIVYDPHGGVTRVAFPASTRAAALEHARQTVDVQIAGQRRRWRG